MTIIIGAGAEPSTPNPLPTVDADLPHPASVPAARPTLDDDRVIALLTADHALVRDFAVEQVAHRAKPELLQALISRITDEDDAVAIEAVTLLDRERYEPATEPLLDAFQTSTGNRTVALAGALATLAPERLLEAVQAKGRLDDRSYGAVASALAITGSEPVRLFLGKALNRSGALNPERRSALYTAVLLSGDPALTTRVLTKAVDDSKQEEPKDASFPSRAAMGTLAGLPLPATRTEAGPDLLKHARTLLERDVRPALSGSEAEALDDAARREDARDLLEALIPVVGLTEHLTTGDADDDTEEQRHRSVSRRRRGLLVALVERAEDIGAIDPKAAALFVAIAARAAGAALAAQLDEATSEGLVALAKAMEIDDHAKLAAYSETDWAEVFGGRSKRDIRRVVTVVVREPFRRRETVQRIVRALMASGHGRALLDAVAEIDQDTGIHELAVTAMGERKEDAESVVIETLTDTPLPEDALPIALMLSALVRTERVAAALGRRFYDLRQHARTLTAQAVLRNADHRLLPLLESRAYEDEPEELAWVILSLVHGEERAGKLADALERIEGLAARTEGEDDFEDGPKLDVTLKCEVCGEALRYRFERAYVDPDAKDEMGDPAFVGRMVCKACGAEDRLKPTPATAATLTEHMLAFLQAAQQGVPPDRPPLVSPARTTVGGKSLGLAAALRSLDEEVKERPDSIRARLHRARTRMILDRPGVEDDLAEAKRIDADAVEADALLATLAMRRRDNDRAAELAIKALKRVKREPEPRLYDAEDLDELRTSLEGYLLELSELGASVPGDVDLSRARRARERMLADRRAAAEATQQQEASPPPEPPAAPSGDGSPDLAAAKRSVGRNEPCPCGSGKKFKRCHGR